MTKLVQRQELGSVLGLNACLFFLDASLSQLTGLPIYAAYGSSNKAFKSFCIFSIYALHYRRDQVSEGSGCSASP